MTSSSNPVHVFTEGVHTAKAQVRGRIRDREHFGPFTPRISAGQRPCSRVHPLGREAFVNTPSLPRRSEPEKGNRLYRDDLHEPRPSNLSAACLQVVSTASADLLLCSLIRILYPGAGAGRG